MIIEKIVSFNGILPDFIGYISDDPSKILFQEDTGLKGERAFHPITENHTYSEIERPESGYQIVLM